MKNKKHIGQLVTIKFKFINEDQNFRGYVVDYNQNWTLLKYNPTDFIREGYVILNNKYTISYNRGEKERFVEKILNLKGNKVNEKDLIPLDNLETILNYLTKKYSVFQFSMRTNKTCWLGKVDKIKGDNLKLNYLTPRGKWEKNWNFTMGNIRTIEFDTDYINSLKLIANKKQGTNP